MAAQGPQQAQDESAHRKHQHRVPQPVERGVDIREGVHGRQSEQRARRGDHHRRQQIVPAGVVEGGQIQVEGRLGDQRGGGRADRGGHERGEDVVPQRPADLAPGQRLGDHQRRRHRRAEQRADGRRLRERRPQPAGRLGQQAVPDPEGEAHIGGDDRVLRAQAGPAREHQGGRQQQTRQHGGGQYGGFETGGGGVGPGMPGDLPHHQTDGDSGGGEHDHHPQHGVAAHTQRVRQVLPQHVLEGFGRLAHPE